MPGLWAVFTVIAAGGQVLRNAAQKELTVTLGTVGATHVRFLFGLPFGLLFLAIVLVATGQPMPRLSQPCSPGRWSPRSRRSPPRRCCWRPCASARSW